VNKHADIGPISDSGLLHRFRMTSFVAFIAIRYTIRTPPMRYGFFRNCVVCNTTGGAENAGVENAGVENAGVDKVWKAVRIKYSHVSAN